MLLNTADAVYLGTTRADAAYLGPSKVWPSAPPSSYDTLIRSYNPVRYYSDQPLPTTNLPTTFTDAVGAEWDLFAAVNQIVNGGPGPKAGLLTVQPGSDTTSGRLRTKRLERPGTSWTTVGLFQIPPGGITPQKGILGFTGRVNQAVDTNSSPTEMQHVWLRSIKVGPTPLAPDWCVVAVSEDGAVTRLTVASRLGTFTSTAPNVGRWPDGEVWWSPFTREDGVWAGWKAAGPAVLPVALTPAQVTALWNAP